MRGRKPKPTALLKLQGTFNTTRHRDRAREPVAAGSLAEPPAGLSPGQLDGWRHALAHAPAGVLRPIDRGLLFIWVEAEDRHRRAAEVQARLDVDNALPLLVKTKAGSQISPYVAIMNSTALVMIKVASELGFTPTARPRLVDKLAAEGAPPSAWAQLRVVNGDKA